MDTSTNLLITGHQVGFASRLQRYNAKGAEHSHHGRNEFLQTLADHHQNLGIEGRADSPERIFDENGEAIEDVEALIEWETLTCPKCNRSVSDTQLLLEHLLESHAKPQDRFWFKNFNTIGKDVSKMLNEAVDTQASCSYVKKKFENSNDMLVCPVDSPLFPFLAMRHIQVFFKELPAGVTDGICLQMLIADTSYTVIFVFTKVASVRRKMKRAFDSKAQYKKLMELEKLCAKVYVPANDIVFKKNRTANETKLLAEALELKVSCTQEDIVMRVNEIKAKREELNNVYSNTVKSDGQIMTSEEKKLISSLATGFMQPVAGKRKTTFKNPSELISTKRKKKSDSAPATPPPNS